MREFAERQKKAIDLLGYARETTNSFHDIENPSEDWALSVAMQLLAVTYAMKDGYQAPAMKIVQEFCLASGVSLSILDKFVREQVS